MIAFIKTTQMILLRLLPTIVFVVSNTFGWLMTANGFQIVGILPTTAFLSQSMMSCLLAFVLYGGLFVCYLAFANSIKTKIKLATILLLFAIVLASLSIYFSFLSVTYEATKDSMMNAIMDKLKNVDEDINQLDRYIKNKYKRQIDLLETLAEEAERGRDETGIAKCGPRCKGYRQTRASLIEKFSGLEIAIEKIPEISDTTELWKKIQAKHNEFSQKISQYGLFLKDAKLQDEISNFNTELSELQKTFSGNESVTKINLVMARVNSFIIKDLFRKFSDENMVLYLFFFLSSIPEIVNLGMSLAMIALDGEKSVLQLKEELSVKEVKRDLERRILSVDYIREVFNKSFDTVKGKIKGNGGIVEAEEI